LEKISALSKTEWIDILHIILPKLSYEITKIQELKEKTEIIAAKNETKKIIKIHISVLGERKLGEISVPIHKIMIEGLSKEEEKEFNKIMLTVRGGG